MPNPTFQPSAWNEYTEWQERDRKTTKKINELIKDIARHPYSGIGKPEPLKYDKSGKWSRRINASDRLVYKEDGDNIIIFSCKGHYDDK